MGKLWILLFYGNKYGNCYRHAVTAGAPSSNCSSTNSLAALSLSPTTSPTSPIYDAHSMVTTSASHRKYTTE